MMWLLRLLRLLLLAHGQCWRAAAQHVICRPACSRIRCAIDRRCYLVCACAATRQTINQHASVAIVLHSCQNRIVKDVMYRTSFLADRTLVTVELLSWLSSVRLPVRHECIVAKWCKIWLRLLLIIDRKSHIGFQMRCKSSTLDNLECH